MEKDLISFVQFWTSELFLEVISSRVFVYFPQLCPVGDISLFCF